jgi:hypothetical protein
MDGVARRELARRALAGYVHGPAAATAATALALAKADGARAVVLVEGISDQIAVETLDLEDELIRAAGIAGIERLLDAQADLGSFRTLQRQPAWRGRRPEEQVRRFLGAGSDRKLRYARLIVGAVDLARIPRPLDAVLAAV